MERIPPSEDNQRTSGRSKIDQAGFVAIEYRCDSRIFGGTTCSDAGKIAEQTTRLRRLQHQGHSRERERSGSFICWLWVLMGRG